MSCRMKSASRTVNLPYSSSWARHDPADPQTLVTLFWGVAKVWQMDRAYGSVAANLPCIRQGSLEERLALIELRSQETHLPEKRVTFRRSKLKLGI